MREQSLKKTKIRQIGGFTFSIFSENIFSAMGSKFKDIFRSSGEYTYNKSCGIPKENQFPFKK